MANDTDLLTSDESGVSTVCRNGEIDGRQESLVGLDMTSGGQDAATLRPAAVSDEKLDSSMANGCVRMREGTVECLGGVEPVVCRSASTTGVHEESLKFAENAACVDSQRSTANGLVSPHAVKLTDDAVYYPQSTESCQNCPPSAIGQTLPEFYRDTFSVRSAEKLHLDDAQIQPQANELSDSACSMQPAALASDLSSLNIAVADSNCPAVPCDDSVSTPLDSKQSRIRYIVYESEMQMESIMQLITKDLSEPYSIYTYRYFIHNWPKLCFLVCICKLNTFY